MSDSEGSERSQTQAAPKAGVTVKHAGALTSVQIESPSSQLKSCDALIDEFSKVVHEQTTAVALNLTLEHNLLGDEAVSKLCTSIVRLITTSSNAVFVQRLRLFGNAIGDVGAAAVAELMLAQPAADLPPIAEIHLSHNTIGASGAAALLCAASLLAASGVHSRASTRVRGTQLRPLWLRMEYNAIPASSIVALLSGWRVARGDPVNKPGGGGRGRGRGRGRGFRGRSFYNSVQTPPPPLEVMYAPKGPTFATATSPALCLLAHERCSLRECVAGASVHSPWLIVQRPTMASIGRYITVTPASPSIGAASIAASAQAMLLSPSSSTVPAPDTLAPTSTLGSAVLCSHLSPTAAALASGGRTDGGGPRGPVEHVAMVLDTNVWVTLLARGTALQALYSWVYDSHCKVAADVSGPSYPVIVLILLDTVRRELDGVMHLPVGRHVRPFFRFVPAPPFKAGGVTAKQTPKAAPVAAAAAVDVDDDENDDDDDDDDYDGEDRDPSARPSAGRGGRGGRGRGRDARGGGRDSRGRDARGGGRDGRGRGGRGRGRGGADDTVFIADGDGGVPITLLCGSDGLRCIDYLPRAVAEDVAMATPAAAAHKPASIVSPLATAIRTGTDVSAALGRNSDTDETILRTAASIARRADPRARVMLVSGDNGLMSYAALTEPTLRCMSTLDVEAAIVAVSRSGLSAFDKRAAAAFVAAADASAAKRAKGK